MQASRKKLIPIIGVLVILLISVIAATHVREESSTAIPSQLLQRKITVVNVVPRNFPSPWLDVYLANTTSGIQIVDVLSELESSIRVDELGNQIARFFLPSLSRKEEVGFSFEARLNVKKIEKLIEPETEARAKNLFVSRNETDSDESLSSFPDWPSLTIAEASNALIAWVDRNAKGLDRMERDQLQQLAFASWSQAGTPIRIAVLNEALTDAASINISKPTIQYQVWSDNQWHPFNEIGQFSEKVVVPNRQLVRIERVTNSGIFTNANDYLHTGYGVRVVRVGI